MARILARFGLPQIRAVVSAGAFSRPEYAAHLVRVLEGRRQRLLERFLTRLSPLSWPVVQGGRVCLEDLAISSGLRDAEARSYLATDELGARLELTPRPNGVCVDLPDRTAQPNQTQPNPPSYLALDVVAATPGAETTAPARVHLYQLGPGRYQVVGLERPDAPRGP